MKKVLFILTSVLMMLSMTSCEWFNNNNEKNETVIENVISEDTSLNIASVNDSIIIDTIEENTIKEDTVEDTLR